MNLTERMELAERLGKYILSNESGWQQAKEEAFLANPWFIPEFVELATEQIASQYLDLSRLQQWAAQASLSETATTPLEVGLVMAGNLPLVGFHDWLCIFISGHQARIKLSAQDRVLFSHLRDKLLSWEPSMAPCLQLAERLNGADAYIATGSDNTARYFEYYFGKFPHIIRKNRTSVAVLTGNETAPELERLSQDLYTYFGRGCRNVTHLLVPRGYSFEPLLEAGHSFQYLKEHHKFKNNYDYQLALRILNKEYYMTNGIALFVEQSSLHAPISLVHYRYYDEAEQVEELLATTPDQVQCRVGWGGIEAGSAQSPRLDEYADGVNTLYFLKSLKKTS